MFTGVFGKQDTNFKSFLQDQTRNPRTCYAMFFQKRFECPSCS